MINGKLLFGIFVLILHNSHCAVHKVLPQWLLFFSLRLGHAAGLTSHRDVIQHRVAASLLNANLLEKDVEEALMNIA